MSAQATIFCRGIPSFPTSARDALTPHAHSSSAPSRELVSHAVASQMDDRCRESGFQASPKQITERHQTWIICLPLEAKQRHLCVQRLHLNQVKLRLFRPVIQKKLFTTWRRLADCCSSSALLRLLSANHSLDRSSPSVHDYPSINSRESVAKKVNVSRTNAPSRSLRRAHASVAVVNTLQIVRKLEPRALSQALGSRCDSNLVISGYKIRQMGRRNGGLVNSVHGDGSTSSRPSVLSEMP